MYELLYIVGSPFTEKDLPPIEEKIKNLIKASHGKIIDEKNLGNKKLAYSIKHVYRGFYILLHFEMPSKNLIVLDKQLRLAAEILRHLITKVAPRIHKKETKNKTKSQLNKIKKKNLPKQKIENKKKTIDLKNLGQKIDKLLKI